MQDEWLRRQPEYLELPKEAKNLLADSFRIDDDNYNQ